MKAAVKRAAGTVDRALAPLLPIRPAATLVIGHRGAPTVYPENTFESFEHALQVGADGIEFDVVFPDGGPVVAHDLPADGAPPLAAVLETLKGRTRRVYVHYKAENGDLPEHVAAIADCIRRTRMADTAVVMVESGNVGPWVDAAPDILILQCWSGPSHHAGRFDPEQGTALGLTHFGIYHQPAQLSRVGRFLQRAGFSRLGTYVGFGLTRRLIAEHRRGGRTFVVFTINDLWTARLYASCGIDAIGTDIPDLLRQALPVRQPTLPSAPDR